jgi:hypothetical protein
MSIYLFRAGSSRTFAYSLDVTGRNIPPVTEQAKWGFERTVNAEQFKAHPQALQRIWEDGCYISIVPAERVGTASDPLDMPTPPVEGPQAPAASAERWRLI